MNRCDRCRGIQALDLAVEEARLLILIGDDCVSSAPPDLERHAGEGDLPRPVERAPDLIAPRIGRRSPSDLEACQPLQAVAEAQVVESPVARGHVRRRIERGGAGQQVWEPRNEQKSLLASHAAADRVDATGIDSQPRDRAPEDVRHSCEVPDLSGVAPGEEGQRPALPFGIDDCERAERGKVVPTPCVRPRSDPAPMWRDDERDRWVVPTRHRKYALASPRA